MMLAAEIPLGEEHLYGEIGTAARSFRNIITPLRNSCLRRSSSVVDVAMLNHGVGAAANNDDVVKNHDIHADEQPLKQ